MILHLGHLKGIKYKRHDVRKRATRAELVAWQILCQTVSHIRCVCFSCSILPLYGFYRSNLPFPPVSSLQQLNYCDQSSPFTRQLSSFPSVTTQPCQSKTNSSLGNFYNLSFGELDRFLSSVTSLYIRVYEVRSCVVSLVCTRCLHAVHFRRQDAWLCGSYVSTVADMIKIIFVPSRS